MIVMSCNESTDSLKMVRCLSQVFQTFGKVGIAANSPGALILAVQSMQLLRTESPVKEQLEQIRFYALSDDANVMGESKLEKLPVVPFEEMDLAIDDFCKDSDPCCYICLVAKRF